MGLGIAVPLIAAELQFWKVGRLAQYCLLYTGPGCVRRRCLAAHLLRVCRSEGTLLLSIAWQACRQMHVFCCGGNSVAPLRASCVLCWLLRAEGHARHAFSSQLAVADGRPPLLPFAGQRWQVSCRWLPSPAAEGRCLPALLPWPMRQVPAAAAAAASVGPPPPAACSAALFSNRRRLAPGLAAADALPHVPGSRIRPRHGPRPCVPACTPTPNLLTLFSLVLRPTLYIP